MLSSERAHLVDPGRVSPVRLPPLDLGVPDRSDRFDEGFAAGVIAGREAAEADAAERTSAALRRLGDAEAALRRAVEELRARRAELLDAQVADIAALAVELTETLVGAFPAKLDPVRLAEVLALAPGDGDLPVVRLHPDDIASLDGAAPPDAEIVADAGIEAGGCVVEVGPMVIDAQLGPALARLRAALCEMDGPR